VNLRRELGTEHSLDLVLAVTRHETARQHQIQNPSRGSSDPPTKSRGTAVEQNRSDVSTERKTSKRLDPA
jgi:hypothetical protein